MIYKFTIAPQGAVGTPLRSDTLFGHACWTMRLHDGSGRFTSFLANAASQKPEIIFSDGFPSGWFPRPFLPVKLFESNSRVEHAIYKKALKRIWVSGEIAEECSWNLLELSLKGAAHKHDDYSDLPQTESVLHNVIDRLTGTSLGKHGLYSIDKHWYHGIWSEIDIFVYTEWEKEYLTQFIDNLFSIGYGRDQSVGLGAVSIVKEPELVNFPSHSTQFYLSLSRAVPCTDVNIANSFYQIETKYGKVWSGLEMQKSPFKKPLLQTIPGSVFNITKKTATAGRVITAVHDNADVLENCMTILYPLPENVMEGVCA